MPPRKHYEIHCSFLEILLKILIFLFTALCVISKSSLLQKDSYVNKIHDNPFYPIYFQFPSFNSHSIKNNNEDGVKFQKYKYIEPVIYWWNFHWIEFSTTTMYHEEFDNNIEYFDVINYCKLNFPVPLFPRTNVLEYSRPSVIFSVSFRWTLTLIWSKARQCTLNFLITISNYNVATVFARLLRL